MIPLTTISVAGILSFIVLTAHAAAQGPAPTYTTPPPFFGAPGPEVTAPSGETPHTILQVGDVNNDGLADALQLSGAAPPQTVFSHWGAIGGGFVLGPIALLGPIAPIISFKLGDVDLDGDLDLALLAAEAGDIILFPNDGAGMFGFGGLAPIPPPGDPLSFVISEVTGDGLPDFVILVNAPGGLLSVDPVKVLVGLGGGAFLGGPITAIGVGLTDMATADVDNDGAADVVALGNAPNFFHIYLGSGAGMFAFSFMFMVPPGAAGTETNTMRIGDVNNDGKVDLTTVRLSPAKIFASFGFGDGVFSPMAESDAPSDTTNNYILGDFNGNGQLDAAYAAPAAVGPGSTIKVQLGLGDTTFGTSSSFKNPGPAYWLATADFDVDGRLDIVTISSSMPLDAGIWYYENSQATPTGIELYGTGTEGCLGGIGMLASGSPIVGTVDLALTSTNAPPNALGLLIVTDSQDLAGTDVFGLGFLLQVDIALAGEVLAFDIRSGPTGSATAIVDIPASPFLVGSTYYAQSIWFWSTATACLNSLIGLTSSKGLSITIQP